MPLQQTTFSRPSRILPMMMAALFSACSKQETSPPPEQASASSSSSAPATSTSASAQQSAPTPAPTDNGTIDQLEEKATQALHDNHMYSPAGNNAIEYYLAIREKEPNSTSVNNALSDLTPYALLAADQSIQRQDFNETKRLIALIEKVDPGAPALPRLKKSLDYNQHLNQAAAATHPEQVANKAKIEDATAKVAKQKLQAHEAQAASNLAVLQEARRAAEKAAIDKKSNAEKIALAKAKAAAQKASSDKAEVEKSAAEVSAATKVAAAKEEEVEKKTTKAPEPAEASLKPLNTPPPVYPQHALIHKIAGAVTIQFTVNKNGSVSSPHIIESKPNHLFDQAVMSAVTHWHFQPIPEEVTTKRTLNFNPN